MVDIGIPPGLAEVEAVRSELLTPEWVGRHLPARPLESHKGIFGHALVVAGSRNYVGAAFLAAQAAVRVGSGLVTLASPESVYPIAAGKLTEVIHMPLPEDAEGRLSPEAADVIHGNISRYSSVLVGCGLGWSPGTTGFVDRLLLDHPALGLLVVVDADGLNCLSDLPDWWRRVRAPMVVTPHPGEMATLTGTPTGELQEDRMAAVRRWAAHWKVPVALKGAFTLIAEPEGLVRVSPFANPGLASGGTGDVLTGVICGLMAQGLTPYQATCCGVHLHGQAAQEVSQSLGNTGMVASDLIDKLPTVLSWLRRQAA